MSEVIKVPDIGGGEGEVIEILVKEGDTVEAEQSLVVLESDKASMEVPCPKGGVVKSIKTRIMCLINQIKMLLQWMLFLYHGKIKCVIYFHLSV